MLLSQNINPYPYTRKKGKKKKKQVEYKTSMNLIVDNIEMSHDKFQMLVSATKKQHIK